MQIQRGHKSIASQSPLPTINVRAERLAPPPELSGPEKDLWLHLVHSRRPQWFVGSEALLRSYVISTVHCQRIEDELRKTVPSATGPYERLARLHRQTVSQCASLARSLRLTVNQKIDASQRATGDLPVGGAIVPWDRGPQSRAVPDAVDSNGERSFAALLARDRGVEDRGHVHDLPAAPDKKDVKLLDAFLASLAASEEPDACVVHGARN
jgi:hypothetical protein